MDLDALRAQGMELVTRFEQLRAEYVPLQQKLLKVNMVAKSPDGYVTATVGPRGQLIKLELDPRIYRRPNSRELASTITKTIQQATEKAVAEVASLCSPFVSEAQFQANMDFDFAGLVEQLNSDLPRVDNGATEDDSTQGRSS